MDFSVDAKDIHTRVSTMTMLRRSFLLLVVLSLYCNVICAWSPSSKDLGVESSRRAALPVLVCAPFLSFMMASPSVHAYSGPMIDVNNAMAREFTAFPG